MNSDILKVLENTNIDIKTLNKLDLILNRLIDKSFMKGLNAYDN
jgi:hypothetical protein